MQRPIEAPSTMQTACNNKAKSDAWMRERERERRKLVLQSEQALTTANQHSRKSIAINSNRLGLAEEQL
jgi:tellurite resistance protein